MLVERFPFVRVEVEEEEEDGGGESTGGPEELSETSDTVFLSVWTYRLIQKHLNIMSVSNL